MGKLTAKHWSIVAGMLGSMSLQLAGLHAWSDLTPAFVFGAIGAMCTTLAGVLLVDKPGAEAALLEARWGPRPTSARPALEQAATDSTPTTPAVGRKE